MKRSENALFEQLSVTLVDSLVKQLSPNGKLAYSNKLSNNEIYIMGIAPNVLTLKDMALLRQINDFSKKYIGKAPKSFNRPSKADRNTNCYKTFLYANELCDAQNHLIKEVLYDRDVEATLNIAREYIYNAFWRQMEDDNPTFLWMDNTILPVGGFSTGTGTCSWTRGKSTFEKYKGEWHFSTVTGTRYLQALRRVSKPLHDIPDEVFKQVVLSESVKATFVDKNLETSRLVIPQLNGDLFLQYPACSLLEKMLKDFNISIDEQQDINREMARKGSLHDNLDIYDHSLARRRPRYCTIDLKSASDIVGMELVRYLIPDPLYRYLEMCRPEYVEFQGVQEKTKMHMMANMGNAYCFPLQTLVFAAIVKALCYRQGLKSQDRIYSVYGDDIIVDVTAYDSVIKTLKSLCMIPNEKKSFSWGFFRESCGGDFYLGRNIRPVMFERIANDGDIYSVANRLIDWGLEHSIDVSAPCSLLLDCVDVRCVVPQDRGATEGLRITHDCIASLPIKWREGLTFVHRVDIIGGRRTEYIETKTVFLNREAVQIAVSNRTCPFGSSTFPFLRGGISQRSRRKDVLPVVFVPSDRVKDTIDSLVVSQWDVPPEREGTQGFWTSSSLRRNAIARLWRVAPS